MLNLKIEGTRYSVALTNENESQVKQWLSHFPPDTMVIIQETGDIERIDTIFNYDINQSKT
jgi:hypothetical protein